MRAAPLATYPVKSLPRASVIYSAAAATPARFSSQGVRHQLRPQHLSRESVSDTPVTGQPCSVKSARTGAESLTLQLFSSAHEDIARLTYILRGQQCTAIMRGIDGVVLPLDGSRSENGNDGRSGSEAAASTPILDPEGRILASLEVHFSNVPRCEPMDSLLRALIDAAARSMTERWFRLVHRRQWILAAMRRNTPHLCVLLAVDQDQRLLAAEKTARQLLGRTGHGFELRMPLSVLFEGIPTLRRGWGFADSSLTLRGSGDREPWVAFLTPPDISAGCLDHDSRVILHTRPRLEYLTRLLFVTPHGPEHQGLTRGSLQRVEEHVRANIDSTLDIDELAGLIRMSPSHFTRSFRKTVGLTPHRYVIQCRVEKARELLSATDLPLTEIALAAGFSDQSHFSRRFQELTGFPPGAYRRNDNRV
jgi:AraC-like DNA-binding protein